MDEAIITINSEQLFDDGNNDSIKFVTSGEFSKIDSHYYICYNESQITGLEGVITSLDIENSRIVLTRKGSVNHEMVFQKGERNHCMYDTGEGYITICVSTIDIDLKLGENGGSLYIEYTLDMSSALLSRNRINILIETKE
ncbi:MAG: DUF1934 domain-containing protein [Bacillota bacterium]|nr:DUF1934 domain-containing protein [Bacillota bacterium]